MMKRGLSTIIATLIIILLVLVAVGIVWGVVRNVIQQSAEEISLGKFTLNMEIEQAQSINDSAVRVKVKRNAGEGEIVAIKFIFDDGKNREVIEKEGSLEQLQQKSYDFVLKDVNASNLRKISIAPVFKLESGKRVTGDIKDELKLDKISQTTEETTCTPNCAGKNCGSDGCEGSCGTCTGGQTCNSTGQCTSSCTDTCASLGYECGNWTICSLLTNCGTCSGGYICQTNGTCIINCTTHSTSACYNGDVYWYNSCGVREEIKQDCNSTQTCINSTCVNNPPASGKTYYVATNGSDSYPGTIGQPFATINKAVSVAKPGDLIYIRGGSYHQTAYIGVSGNSSFPITISGYPGEEAIIDGAFNIPSGEYDPLVYVDSDYIIIKDLTIQKSYGMGMLISGEHDRASNINSYRNMENGIFVSGNYGIVEDSDMGWNCLSNENYSRTRFYWSTGLSAGRHPINVTLRRNIVHDNWGEGLSTFEAEYTLMEDNIVYNNQANVYISDTKHTILRRNLIYSTPGNPIEQYYQQTGIMIGDEQYNPASSDNIIVNNIVVGNEYNLYFWEGASGGGLVNVIIAHNTFVNSVQAGDVLITGGTHSNSRFENNLMLQEGSVPIGVFSGSTSGLTFSNNLWSKSPPSAMSGAGDIIGDPKIIQTGPILPGQVSPDWFKIASDSPAINAGKTSEITEDFFKTSRPVGAKPDMGAYEYH